MSDPSPNAQTDQQPLAQNKTLPTLEASVETVHPTPSQSKDSYVKLAMRNMVRKRGISLKHFVLTTFGLLTVLIGLSYLTR